MGLGAVLAQRYDDKEFVIQYASRELLPSEKKWSTREKEALGIIYACEKFRHQFVGSHFIVETDHQSLEWLLQAQSPARLVRWALRLSEFDFIIKYRKGSANKNAYCLSRLTKELDESWNDDRLEEQLFVFGQNKHNQRLEVIEKLQHEDFQLKPFFNELNNYHRLSSFFISGGLLYKRENSKILLVVPEALKEVILYKYHNENSHLSRDRLLELLKKSNSNSLIVLFFSLEEFKK